MRGLPQITGQLVDAAGDPVDGLQIELHNTDPGGDCPGGIHSTPEDNECHDWNHRTTSNGFGGRFGVWIGHGEVFSLVVRGEARRGYETTVVHGVEAGEHVRIDVPPGDEQVDPVSVGGVVTDANGDPVAGAEVAAVELDTELEDRDDPDRTITAATTDGAGLYQLDFDPLDLANFERRIVVRVETADGAVDWQVGDVAFYELGSMIVADIHLGPPGTVSGTVLDADGNPMSGAEVCCDTAGATTVADPEGDYTLAFRAACVGNRVRTQSARGEGSPLIVARLAPDHRYRCRVRARNDLGWGIRSAYSLRFRTVKR